MKALVTGASGFIGSHLVEYLLEQGLEVRAMLRYTSYAHMGWLRELSAELLQRVEIIRGDLKDASFCRKAVQGCDYVFHLGALISIPFSYTNPADYIQTNVTGTLNLLEAAREVPELRRFVQTSSSEVYGTAQFTPIDEGHPLNPQSPYAASKVGADALATSFYLTYKLPVTLIRPFNTYGPRQSSRAVIPVIISQVLHKEVVTLGNTAPKRDFLYVKDTVAGFWQVGTHVDTLGETVNLGTGATISIGDLFEKVCELEGKSPRLEVSEKRIRPDTSEVMELVADTAKANRLAGWQPKYGLESGLRETIEWIRGRMDDGEFDEYRV